MSRLGKLPIEIPQGINVTYEDGVFSVKGAKGALARRIRDKEISVKLGDGIVTLALARETDEARALWGTYAAHIRNMFAGLTEGFEKQLEIEGVGYRAEAQGNEITLHVGFSHPVKLQAQEGVEVSVEKNLITVRGADKDAVGQFAANIRAVKKPEPYKGKGIHYVGEYIIRKQGKKAL